MKEIQKGFALQEVLIAVCILSAIGYGIYWVINFIASL